MPEEVPGYRVLDQVGQGGFSTVYRAHQERLDRTVALKVLSVDSVDGAVMRRFVRECRITGRLTGHPNVVTVLDTGNSRSGRPFIAMEYFERGSLTDRLSREGSLPVPDVLRIGVKISAALAAVHEADVLHRDVKPQNILVSRYGEPALTDFGIALLTETLDATHTNAFTPQHAAPEVLNGKPLRGTSDIYALGSSLYQLLAGTPAFHADPGGGIAPLILRIISEPPPPINRPDVPSAVFDAVCHAMAKEPDDRFANAIAFAVELRRLQAELGLPVTEVPHSGSGHELPPAPTPGPPVPLPGSSGGTAVAEPGHEAAPVPERGFPAPQEIERRFPSPQEIARQSESATPPAPSWGGPVSPAPSGPPQPSAPGPQPPPYQPGPPYRQPVPDQWQPPGPPHQPAPLPPGPVAERRADPPAYAGAAPAPGGAAATRPASEHGRGGSGRGMLLASVLAVVATGAAVGLGALLLTDDDSAPGGGQPTIAASHRPTSTPTAKPTTGGATVSDARLAAARPRDVRVVADNGNTVVVRWKLRRAARRLPVFYQKSPGAQKIVPIGNGARTVTVPVKRRVGYCFQISTYVKPGNPPVIARAKPVCIRGARPRTTGN